MQAGWSTCPGCRLVLPASGAKSLRAGASAECWTLYGELIGYEAEHLARLGRYHQLMVDTYAAQHPSPDGPSIGLAFALIGLHLALDLDWRGDQVRDAHQLLAERSRDWPTFDAPLPPARVTVFDVAMAGLPDGRAVALQQWAAGVWQGWAVRHDDVRALVQERLPSEDRRRLTAR
jgi:hypothetical protein